MKDGGSYLQSDRSGGLFQSFTKRPLVAIPRRRLAARRDNLASGGGRFLGVLEQLANVALIAAVTAKTWVPGLPTKPRPWSFV